MTKKGFKKAKGEPAYWDEMKKRYTIALTPTAIKQLDELAKQRELSRSELVEKIARGIIPLGTQGDSSTLTA